MKETGGTDGRREKQHLIRETTFNIFYGTSQSNHIYIFTNSKV